MVIYERGRETKTSFKAFHREEEEKSRLFPNLDSTKAKRQERQERAIIALAASGVSCSALLCCEVSSNEGKAYSILLLEGVHVIYINFSMHCVITLAHIQRRVPAIIRPCWISLIRTELKPLMNPSLKKPRA